MTLQRTLGAHWAVEFHLKVCWCPLSCGTFYPMLPWIEYLVDHPPLLWQHSQWTAEWGRDWGAGQEKTPWIQTPGQKLSLQWRQNLKPETRAATQQEMCTSLTRWFSHSGRHFTVYVTYYYTFQKLTFFHTRCLYLKINGKKSKYLYLSWYLKILKKKHLHGSLLFLCMSSPLRIKLSLTNPLLGIHAQKLVFVFVSHYRYFWNLVIFLFTY